MKKFIIKYTDKSGDLTSVWVTAENADDAVRTARREYWDICDIVDVYEDTRR